MSACAFDIVSRAVWKLGSRAPRPVPFPGPFARDGWGGPLAFWRHLPRWALVGNCPGVLELEDARGLVGQGLVGSRQRRPGRRGAAPATRPILELDKFALSLNAAWWLRPQGPLAPRARLTNSCWTSRRSSRNARLTAALVFAPTRSSLRPDA